MKTVISLMVLLCLVGCSKVVGPGGVAGPAGPQGDKGDTGAQGVAGQDGTNGQDGADGTNGTNGVDGQDGAQGPAGEDGKIARVVPLCPGQSNYGTFVEVAMCINNKLYAVYSLNGGFLTYLAPGDYTSNGVGSSCNFTVQQNCVVHNN